MNEKSLELRKRILRMSILHRCRPEKHVLIIGNDDYDAFDKLCENMAKLPERYKGYELYFDDGPTRFAERFYREMPEIFSNVMKDE